MSKLVIVVVLAVLFLGVGIFVFDSGDNGGVKNQVKNGYTSVTNTTRDFDYVTN